MIVLYNRSSLVIPSTSGCSSPLPLLTHLPDSSLTSDSQQSDVSGASRSRLSQEDDAAGSRAGWIAAPTSTAPWIEADLLHAYLVTGVATRGRSAQNVWIETFTLQHSVDASAWSAVGDASGSDVTFAANSDDDAVVEHAFVAVEARYVRLNVVTWHRSPALRWQVYGCIESKIYFSHLACTSVIDFLIIPN